MASGRTLPSLCIRCGAPGSVPVSRTLTSYYVDAPIWPEGSFVLQVVGGPPARGQQRALVHYMLCQRHHRSRRWGPPMGIGLGLLGAAVFLEGLLEQRGLLMLVGLAWIAACYALYAVSGSDPVRVDMIQGDWVWLRRIHSSIVRGLPLLTDMPDGNARSGAVGAGDAEPAASPDDRVPCPDDTCVGIVSREGRCGTCGKAA